MKHLSKGQHQPKPSISLRDYMAYTTRCSKDPTHTQIYSKSSPSGTTPYPIANHVCKLKKSFYELQQAPRCWFSKLAKTLKKYGTKHIKVDCHFLKDEVLCGNVITSYVCSTNQSADILTKALGHEQFEYLLSKLDIRNLYTST
ncbi:hypothetical protein CR513_03184, partial [Mucuna pruriens]